MYKVHDSRDAAIKLREAGNLDEAVKEESVYLAIKIIAIGYWVPLLIFGVVGNFVEDFLGLSILIFWVIQLLVWGVSWVASKLSFLDWYKKVFFYGARELAIMLTNGSIKPGDNPWWQYPFEIWWAFSMKYFFSWAVWWLMMLLLRADLPIKEDETFYGNYHVFWQIM